LKSFIVEDYFQKIKPSSGSKAQHSYEITRVIMIHVHFKKTLSRIALDSIYSPVDVSLENIIWSYSLIFIFSLSKIISK